MLNKEKVEQLQDKVLSEINTQYKCVGESSHNIFCADEEIHSHKSYSVCYKDNESSFEKVSEILTFIILRDIEKDFPHANTYVHRKGPDIDCYLDEDGNTIYSLYFRAGFGVDWTDTFTVTDKWIVNLLGVTDDLAKRVKALENKDKVNV